MTKMRHQCILAVLVVAVIFPLLFLGQKASCYSLKAPTTRRREFVGSLCSKTAQFILFAPTIAYAKEQPSTLDADLNLLKESTEVLDSLIENWQKATTDCTYADVPRELLEAKNKKQLLEKASGNYLYLCLMWVWCIHLVELCDGYVSSYLTSHISIPIS